VIVDCGGQLLEGVGVGCEKVDDVLGEDGVELDEGILEDECGGLEREGEVLDECGVKLGVVSHDDVNSLEVVTCNEVGGGR
jgi:hypothetical protein